MKTMPRLLIFGNSGSGKSTLAARLASERGLLHLDLDSLAWEPEMPPTRRPLADACAEIDALLRAAPGWVVEGCYADLLEHLMSAASTIIYLDLPVDACQDNARRRPWEPHKYPSQEAQDANLPMLLDWIADYPGRGDTFSRTAHEALFQAFTGARFRLASSAEASAFGAEPL